MATETTKIPYVEGAAAATPSANRVVTYAKADGLMYSKDDAGVETLMSGGAGGSGMATDPLWDAKGDLAGGTGANTAARLAVGANDTVLVAASGEATGLKWSAAGLMRVARKTGDQASTSASMADVTDLTAAVAASTNYHFRCVVFYNSAATTTGLRLAINGPAGATLKAGGFLATGAGGTNDSTIAQGSSITLDASIFPTTSGPGGTNAAAIVEGTLLVAGTSGTLALRFATEVAASAVTIESGSLLLLTQY